MAVARLAIFGAGSFVKGIATHIFFVAQDIIQAGFIKRLAVTLFVACQLQLSADADIAVACKVKLKNKTHSLCFNRFNLVMLINDPKT
nr:hypothetical protein [Phascolarctobacterium succinatutens]